jgi:hypothetical protein
MSFGLGIVARGFVLLPWFRSVNHPLVWTVGEELLCVAVMVKELLAGSSRGFFPDTSSNRDGSTLFRLCIVARGYVMLVLPRKGFNVVRGSDKEANFIAYSASPIEAWEFIHIFNKLVHSITQ